MTVVVLVTGDVVGVEATVDDVAFRDATVVVVASVVAVPRAPLGTVVVVAGVRDGIVVVAEEPAVAILLPLIGTVVDGEPAPAPSGGKVAPDALPPTEG